MQLVKNSDLYEGVRGVFYRDLIVMILVSALAALLAAFVTLAPVFRRSGGTIVENKNRKHVMYEYAGFSMGAGMMIDYKLKHTINSRFKGWGVDATETQLRVKPYFNFTLYNNGIGWVPAINLAVGVNTKTYRMKEK